LQTPKRSTPRELYTHRRPVHSFALSSSPSKIMRASTHGMFHGELDSLPESVVFHCREGRNAKRSTPVAKWRSSALCASIAHSAYEIGVSTSTTFRYIESLSMGIQSVGSSEHQAAAPNLEYCWTSVQQVPSWMRVSRPIERWANRWHSLTMKHLFSVGICVRAEVSCRLLYS
jgi:hypothetical protein